MEENRSDGDLASMRFTICSSGAGTEGATELSVGGCSNACMRM